MRPVTAALVVFALMVAPRISVAQERGVVALGEAVRGLGSTVRVLMIGAHPDDEDTQLITWLQRSGRAEVAYLSLTRGDGGQNLIGNELGEALGVIRTEELLAARRVDGARQYFTRAYDFGFSKSAEETYLHWPKDSLLRDVVAVVRAFRPHVVIGVFSGTPRDGHGHHQVSGMLAREAYDIAGDSSLVSVAAAGRPWTPLKFYRAARFNREAGTLRMNIGEFDVLRGRSYGEIAGESRSQHRSQAFGTIQPRGVSWNFVRREASRVNEATPATDERSMFDGVDTSWTRIAASLPARARPMVDSIARLVTDARRSLDLADPSRSVVPLSRLHGVITRLHDAIGCGPATACTSALGDAATTLADGQTRAAHALAVAAGIQIDALVPNARLAAGDTMSATIVLHDRGPFPLRVREVSIAVGEGSNTLRFPSLSVASDSTIGIPIPVRGPITTLAWLTQPRRGDLFANAGWPAPNTATPAQDEGARAMVRVSILAPGGDTTAFTLVRPVERRFADRAFGEMRHPLAVVPAISVTLPAEAQLARAGSALDLTIPVLLRSASAAEREARVSLRLPAGLTADSTARLVRLPPGAVRTVEFRVRGRLAGGTHTIAAVAESGGQRFTAGYLPIEYEHIRPQQLYRDAVLTVRAVDVRVPANIAVGYVQGVGDNVAPVLRELGIPLTMLEPASLGTADLSPYTAIVIGTRAYEANPDLVAHNARLLEWVRRGGTLVVQYGQYEMQTRGIMPYPITLGRPAQRVTIEEAPVTIVDAASPLLAYPNRITSADFAGWSQDRTIYMPATFDEQYAAPLETHDPGEPPNRGAILAAPYGRGMYVYTTLAFFRQLPAGVPGATRLFANLLAARQSAAQPTP